MKTPISLKKICQVFLLLLVTSQLHAQADPALQQENLSGSNNINKLRTVLDWSGLINSSNIPTVGGTTNNGQKITTPATGFQYQIDYFKRKLSFNTKNIGCRQSNN